MGELVECHSGFTYADKPVALTWEGRRLEIVADPGRMAQPGEAAFPGPHQQRTGIRAVIQRSDQ